MNATKTSQSRRWLARPVPALSAHRSGSALLVVLVLVVVFALGAYTFSDTMIAEYSATVMYGRDAQRRAFADSGVELVAAILGTPPETTTETNYYHNPDQFRGVLVADSNIDQTRGRFSIIAPMENDPTSTQVRFGLIDESGKLNLNNLIKLEDDDETEGMAQAALMQLPDMTSEIADAILDWLDDDTDPREEGAEDEYYQGLNPPYVAKNGRFESLEELLLVRGVTPWLLFGEDANRNGLLDLNENDGDLSAPNDIQDDVLNVGWSGFLTVHSRESNLRIDRSPRINVNDNNLGELYDTLEEEFDAETALFIVAYRISGPREEEEEEDGQAQGSKGGSGDDSDSDANAPDDTRGGGGRQPATDEEALQQLASGVSEAIAGGDGTVTRGGMDLSGGGQVTLTSIFELIGAEVDATVEEKETILSSPWSSDPGNMGDYLPDLLDALSTTDDASIEGRININQARYETLMGVPGMTETLADAIVSSQMVDASGQPLPDQIALRSTTGWLVIEGLVDLPLMRSLDPYISAGGDVYRAQIVGYFDKGGPVSRLEAVFDATEWPVKVMFFRDLTGALLGPGYHRRHLGLAEN